MNSSLKNPIKVVVVDDSAVVRGLISRMLEKYPEVSVINTLSNGELAVKFIKGNDVDVVILDIEMPVMDGLTALPKILEVDPEVKVIMASGLTMKNAEISLKALQAGAADYIPKPSTNRELTGGQDFEHELIEKVKAFGDARRHRPTSASKPTVREKAIAKPKRSDSISLLKRSAITPKPQILAVGSSTGGPQALFELFKGLNGKINVPIVVTQHMPPTFTTILAQHVTRSTGIPATEAKNGDELKAGEILIAPGDFHMIIKKVDGKNIISLNQDEPENFCRPAVDPMLRSVVDIYGDKTFVVILTGMGYDGMKGSKIVSEKGGTIFAQDEESSVVWGMPGAVAEAGICTEVLPITKLAPKIIEYFSKGI